jgi:hypothetical protein
MEEVILNTAVRHHGWQRGITQAPIVTAGSVVKGLCIFQSNKNTDPGPEREESPVR